MDVTTFAEVTVPGLSIKNKCSARVFPPQMSTPPLRLLPPVKNNVSTERLSNLHFVIYLGTGTTEIAREDLPEDDTILPQVVTTAREPSLQKDPILYATETGCSLFVGLPWIHVAANMDITGHIACSVDTIRRSPL